MRPQVLIRQKGRRQDLFFFLDRNGHSPLQFEKGMIYRELIGPGNPDPLIIPDAGLPPSFEGGRQ